MHYEFPANFNFFDLLGAARTKRFDPMAFSGQVELDFSQLAFAGPCAMACIKALLTKAQETLPPEHCFLIQHKCQDAIRYLIRMDFFSDDIRWCMPPDQDNFVRHTAEGRFLPITNLKHMSHTSPTSRKMVECLEMDDSAAKVLRYALSELIDNSLQHAFSLAGAFVTAQKFPKLNRVHLLIADTGMGIRTHLAEHPKFRQIPDDVTAIQTALKPFVTGTYVSNPQEDQQDYQNQGLGLSVIDQIARLSGGVFHIWSGNGLYSSTSNNVTALEVTWPGTIVFLALPIKLNVNITDIVRSFDLALPKPTIALKFN